MEDWESKYIENISQISSLLAENERILKEAGYKPPVNNFSVDNDKRIKIPSGYIRRSGEFRRLYHLNEIVSNRNTKNNTSYALQLSDYYNFVLNRFYIWGSIETMFYKNAFVNIISIVEALILESANQINQYCKNCLKIKECPHNISKKDRSNMKFSVNKLFELGILNMKVEEKNRLLELYDFRNKIHIRLNEQNEFLDNIYTQKLYNEAIVFLQKVDRLLWVNAVPCYTSCILNNQK